LQARIGSSRMTSSQNRLQMPVLRSLETYARHPALVAPRLAYGLPDAPGVGARSTRKARTSDWFATLPGRMRVRSPIQLPVVGKALQLVPARIFEHESRAHDEIPHRVGDENLASSGDGPNASTYDHRGTASLIVDRLDLARVKASTNL
jgi:hypothetical protein